MASDTIIILKRVDGDISQNNMDLTKNINVKKGPVLVGLIDMQNFKCAGLIVFDFV